MFKMIPEDEWKIREQVEANRKRTLISPPPYEEITNLICASSKVENLNRERSKKYPSCFRVFVSLLVDQDYVDIFHNSASGYRAQYYFSCENGVAANKYILCKLTQVVRRYLDTKSKRTCPKDWVIKSLSSQQAKIWINQGHWLRHKKLSERNLSVPRWLNAADQSADTKSKKIAVWASLTPATETHLIIKGGFLTADGVQCELSEKDRSLQIHQFGFT